MRILLVDDHDDTRIIMGRMLKMRGFEVVEAATKAEAIQKFREQSIDLLISDLGLPDGSGHDLMTILCSEGPVKGIALSGYGMAEDVARSREAGFQAHLIKPIDFGELDQMIQRVLA